MAKKLSLRLGILLATCALLASASPADPKRAQKAYELGRDAAAKNRFAEALESLSTAILYAPDLADAYRERGKVFLLLKDTVRATADFREAVRLQPADGESCQALGGIELAAERWPLAITNFTHALGAGSPTAFAYNGRARARVQQKQYAEAIADFTAGIRLRLDDPQPYFERGKAALQLERWRDAIDDFNRCIDFRSDWADAYNNLAYNGELSIVRRPLEEAGEHWRQAITARLVCQIDS